MRAKSIGVVTALATFLSTGSPAAAQQRPYITDDPKTIGSGRLLFEAGVDYDRAARYSLSGLTGNLLSVPTMGISTGLSSIAELQIDGGAYSRMTIIDQVPAPLCPQTQNDETATSSIRDVLIGTKLRLLSERSGRPALGVRFATRLPNASNESGLGRGTTDFTIALLIGKTMQSIPVVGNLGFGFLVGPGPRDQDYGVTVGVTSIVNAFRVP